MNPDGTFAQSDEYIWLDDLPIAQVRTTYGASNAIASQSLTYIHADHLNTPRAMTDATKKVIWKWESEAYGKNAPNTDPDNDGTHSRLDLRFPGQIADAETGFYYNMNRYYDPVTGRYTQSDPIGLAGGLNIYAYTRGNPLRHADPLGLFTSVVVTRDYGIGSHSAIYTSNGDGGNQPSLYDPAGSYQGARRGSGDLFFGNDADLEKYIAYQKSTGSSIDVYSFYTTAEQEQAITQRADLQGGAAPGRCARATSSALDGIGPFRGLGIYSLPGSLADALKNLSK